MSPVLARLAIGVAATLLAGAALAQLKLPDSSASAPPSAATLPSPWDTLHERGSSKLLVERTGHELMHGALVYRIRDFGNHALWIAARCGIGERAEIGPQRYGAVTPQSADWSTLRWTRPAHGTKAEADMQHACGLARQRGMAVDPAPAWRDEELAALHDAWLHSAGFASFDWRVVYFASEADARRGRLERWGSGTWHLAPPRHAASLVDVPPPLRRPLMRLWDPGSRSPVLALRGVHNEPEWAVVELVKRGAVERAADAQDFKHRAQRWAAEGLIEPPERLLQDAKHRARAAYWRALTPEQVQRIDPAMSPNLHFGDDSTPLVRAVLMDNEPLARTLLDRGADVNLCGAVGCPLQVARVNKDETRRLLWFDLLLAARGANPDAVDMAFAGASTTVLSSAAYDGDMPLLRRLLAAGASPDGAPGVTATPLETALAGGRREVAELLLQRGASVLPLPDRSVRDPSTGVLGRGNAWLAAGEAKEPALQAWVESLMLAAARANPAYAVDAFIEQEGKRQALADGASLTLRAAPFKLVFRLSGPDSTGVVLGASFSPQFAASARQSTRGNGLLIPTRSSALANTPEPDSYELMAYDAPAPGRPADQGWGAHMALRPVTDSRDRRDFHAASGREYTREVRAIQPVPEEGDLPPAEPMAGLKGRSLALVFGSTLLLDPIEWAPWVQVRSVTLNFR